MVQPLYEQVGYVGFGVTVQLVEWYHDITVGKVAHAAHLLVYGSSSESALVVQFYDFVKRPQWSTPAQRSRRLVLFATARDDFFFSEAMKAVCADLEDAMAAADKGMEIEVPVFRDLVSDEDFL